MNETNLEDRLNKLVSEFRSTPSPGYKNLTELAKQVQANYKKLEKSLNSLQESLDNLRVYIKYQTFDLECTRRENQYLRKLLEEREYNEFN